MLEHGGSEDQAIAGLLHDAVEDAAPGQGPDVLDAITSQFGAAVGEMVAACSDSLNDEGGKRPWRERKLAYVTGLGTKHEDALLVTAADKVHNARAIARDLRTFGPAFWTTFSACEHDLLWYYTAVEAAITARLGGHEIVDTLHRAVDELLAAAEMGRSAVPAQPSNGGCPHHRSAG
ncbi:HD domain-containing protein [Blastococcus sp. SYSU D00669]